MIDVKYVKSTVNNGFLRNTSINCLVWNILLLDLYLIYQRILTWFWHVIYIHKLKSYGLSDQVFSPIFSFPSNKKLQVDLDGQSSTLYRCFKISKMLARCFKPDSFINYVCQKKTNWNWTIPETILEMKLKAFLVIIKSLI